MIAEDDLTPALWAGHWSPRTARRETVAPWWRENSKESYNTEVFSPE
jgi:hypothetical protein